MRSLLFAITLAASSLSAYFLPGLKTDYWNVGYFNEGMLYSASVKIDNGDGTTSDKKLFHKMTFEGAKIGGVYYDKSRFTAVGDYEQTIEYGTVWDHFKGYTSYFSINCDDGYVRRVRFSYYLFKSGKFQIFAHWYQDHNNEVEEVYIRNDYDIDAGLGYSNNDIVETVHNVSWNNFNVYWGYPYEYHYNYTITNPVDNGGIEYNISARFTRAYSPEQQLGFVFWSWYQTPYDLTFKKFGGTESHALPPYENYNSSVKIQDVFNATNYYSNYAYHGTDQVVWISLKENPATMGVFGLEGKAFHRPNARSLNFYVNVMSGAPVPNFNGDIGGGKTLTDAINSLTLGKWSTTVKTGIPNIYGDYMTHAQVHDFMMANRNYGNTVYSYENRENFSDYTLEANILDVKSLDSPNALGVMFDTDSYGNAIPREGFGIFYKKIEEELLYTSDREKLLASIFAHEMGHGLNFAHEMSSCGAAYCTGYSSIMSYCNMFASGTLVSMCTGEFEPDVVSFYRFGPEAWVKPGRYGYDFEVTDVREYSSYQ